MYTHTENCDVTKEGTKELTGIVLDKEFYELPTTSVFNMSDRLIES